MRGRKARGCLQFFVKNAVADFCWSLAPVTNTNVLTFPDLLCWGKADSLNWTFKNQLSGLKNQLSWAWVVHFYNINLQKAEAGVS